MNKENKKFNPWIVVGCVLGALVIVAIMFGIRSCSSSSDEGDSDAQSELDSLRLANEQLELTNQQIQLSNEFENLSSDFQMFEGAVQKVGVDSISRKYNAAKQRIEDLKRQLEDAKKSNNKSKEQIANLQSQIAALQKEIDTLKSLLRHYIQKVDSLGKENAGLRTENASMRTENERLISEVATATEKNQKLSERMTLAEKINVTGISLQATGKNGKAEKNVTKAKQLVVTFTIPQNNSTPVGAKNIYMRIITPEGKVCGGGGSFNFEGQSVPYTARKSVEYGGEEISGIRMYWDVNTTLNPGTYTVELFTDGYRLKRASFTLNK